MCTDTWKSDENIISASAHYVHLGRDNKQIKGLSSGSNTEQITENPMMIYTMCIFFSGSIIMVRWAKLVIYFKFLLDVARQKLLKLANFYGAIQKK